MSWNINLNAPSWSGYKQQSKILNISTINANSISTNTLTVNDLSANKIDANELNISTIHASNIYGYNNFLDYIKNINIITNVITLDEQGLTATSGGLYLNGNLIGSPSTISSIADWSQFKAQTNVDMANSTIRNALGISSIYLSTGNMNADIINCDTVYAIGGRIDTLYGLDQINYPKGKIENFTASNILTSTLTATADIFSYAINNETEISTFSLYADQVNAEVINNYYPNAVFNGNLINGRNIELSNLMRSRGISTINISSGTLTTGYIDTDELNAVQINSYNINNINLIQSDTLYARGAVISTLAVQYVGTAPIFSISSLRANTISTNTITGLVGNFSTLNVGSISSASIFLSSINSSNGVFDNLYTNNIYNTSNINTQTAKTNDFTCSNDANLNNLTAGGNLTFNNNLSMNGDINFPTNTIYTVDHPFTGLTQFLKDINNTRNLSAEMINVVGGATGNRFFPPYRNNSYMTIGNSDGVIDEWLGSPAIVVLNGVNGYVPGVDANATTALTVRGDLDVDYGELTCYNGANFYPFAATANALSAFGDVNIAGALTVEGIQNITGLATFEGGIDVFGLATFEVGVNILGALGVEGETNLAGAVTCEAGIGIVGAMGLTGGDITFGSAIDTTHTFTNYGTTSLNNTLQMNGNKISNVDVINTSYISNYGLDYITYQAPIDMNYSNDILNVSSMTINNIRMKADADNNTTIYFDNSNNILTGAIGLNNDDNLIMGSINNTIIQSLSNNILYSIKDTNIYSENSLTLASSNIMGLLCLSTIKMITPENIVLDASGVVIVNDTLVSQSSIYTYNATVSSITYVDISNNITVPTFIGSTLQYWNGSTYDFKIPQLCYADLSNNLTRPIAYDWSYYPCENLNLNMGGNYITNCAGLSIGTLYVNQATDTPGIGYVNAGVAFSALSGDTYWWQLIKPQFSSYPVPGNEGIYVLQRKTADGSENAKGRIYDDTIYTPWANVSGDLNMQLSSIIFKDQATSIEFGINFSNNFLQYTQIGYGSRYVAQDWPYFPADHWVDMGGNTLSNADVVNSSNVSTIQVYTSSINADTLSYQGTLQPFIQYGTANTGTAPVVITLPVPYANSNYVIQITYAEDPAGNQPVYCATTKTNAKFDFHGANNKDVYWTTFGVI